MLWQISKPEMPQLVIEVTPDGIALLVQRFQIAEDLSNPLATVVQPGIIRSHEYRTP
jgi:hypothetical protein